MTITHVLGFAHCRSFVPLVLLIRKLRPAWQAGRLNGVGGKVEFGESPDEAMAREFREETGHEAPLNWRWVVTVDDSRNYGHYFAVYSAEIDTEDLLGIARGQLHRILDPALELVEVHPAEFLPPDTLASLRYLVPLALDRYLDGGTLRLHP